MKYFKSLLLYILTFSFCYLYSQSESKKTKDSLSCIQCDSLYNQICPDDAVIFGGPERLAQFPGGEEALMIFLRNHIKYPSECKKNAIQGRVVVKFIIDESGKIICPRIIKSLHPSLDEEALRVVKLMPNWKPASNNEVPCKTCYTLPVFFKL